MISLTGVPATGKSTVSAILAGEGYRVCRAVDIAREAGCISGEDVDIECLREKGKFRDCDIVEGHYSHLLPCEAVIILQADTEILRKRMEERGYSSAKISGNIDAQLAGTIYFDALDRMPSSRIFIIDTTSMEPGEVAGEIRRIFSGRILDRIRKE